MAKNKCSLFGNKYLNIIDGDLKIGEFSVKDFSNSRDSPLFLFHNPKIRDNITLITDCFNEVFPHSQGFYSTKSNYLEGILKIVKESDFGAEIVGEMELDLLKKISFPPEKILAGGPYLSDRFLDSFIGYGVGHIVVYQIEDLKRIQKQAEELHCGIQNILIRFCSPKYTARHGIDATESNLIELEKVFNENHLIQYCGILSHLGTRLKTFENYKKNILHIIEIVNLIQSSTTLQTDILNIGGGFPNAGAVKKKPFIEILKQVKKILGENGLGEKTIYYEPGRYVVADTGFCLAQVYKIDSVNSTVFLNVGNNFIPKFMKSSLRFYNVSNITESMNTAFDIMGNIPSDQDILIKNFSFNPSVSVGDFVLISNVGAYSLTWSTRFPYRFPKVIFLGNKSELEMGSGDPN